ncbi:SGNH hydrolase-type esterase domain-containing protein [Truncatella angustata]|uniref:SGNH hydrolase-type esterase domain-containing protein n=1 Tax=Truncatella angustata TaxID=152316 RepID=A0A9P8UQL9_9PEZI|nr:SGNH hydrolase-type esterase domain-containing protein [Truncatella angustata]KAH6656563.1 SGNH hydrolase-type esterase domain-containing protein [Truncatella angustata]KAH8196536.1 hypothetical protein TruAng_009298 [Truncatella angustata]
MPLHIVNIGSSFAAGPGIPPQVEPIAARSGENYANIVAQKLNAKLTDLSVSGATLLNLLEEPQVKLGKTFAPQVSDIPIDADVVLVLGGGNDMGYIGGLFGDSFKAYAAIRIIWGIYNWASGSTEQDATTLSVDDLVGRYGKVLDAAHNMAPKAQVIVVEYLSLLGPALRPGIDVPFDRSRVERHEAKAAQVQDATARAIQGREQWCARVAVADTSKGHGLGSKEPWVNGFGVKELYTMCGYHPNAEGMKAVAEMVLRKLAELGLA